MGGRHAVLLAPIGRAHLPLTTPRAGMREAIPGGIPERHIHSTRENTLAAEPAVPHQMAGPQMASPPTPSLFGNT